MIAARSPITVAVLGASRLFGESLAARLRSDRRIAAASAVVFQDSQDLEWGAAAGLSSSAGSIVLVDAGDETAWTEAAREAVAREAGGRVVVCGVSEDDPRAVGWVEAGAVGFVPREAPFERLVETLCDAWHGQLTASPALVARLIERLREREGATRGDDGSVPEPLSGRQGEIAELVAAGLANKQIARRLGIRPATVRNHVHEILRKRRLTRRGQLAPRTRMSGTTREDGTRSVGVWGSVEGVIRRPPAAGTHSGRRTP